MNNNKLTVAIRLALATCASAQLILSGVEVEAQQPQPYVVQNPATMQPMIMMQPQPNVAVQSPQPTMVYSASPQRQYAYPTQPIQQPVVYQQQYQQPAPQPVAMQQYQQPAPQPVAVQQYQQLAPQPVVVQQYQQPAPQPVAVQQYQQPITYRPVQQPVAVQQYPYAMRAPMQAPAQMIQQPAMQPVRQAVMPQMVMQPQPMAMQPAGQVVMPANAGMVQAPMSMAQYQQPVAMPQVTMPQSAMMYPSQGVPLQAPMVAPAPIMATAPQPVTQPMQMVYQYMQTPQGVMLVPTMLPQQMATQPAQAATAADAQNRMGSAVQNTAGTTLQAIQPTSVSRVSEQSSAPLNDGVAALVAAQQDADSTPLQAEEVGARIKTSASPTVVLSAENFSPRQRANVESALNTLPQAVPGLDRTSNNPGNGTATVDLRGLGATRTKVLVNGRPAVPAGASGAVDLNAIPSALIERVDIVTGGNAAAVGSGAIAGVVDFRLKDDFEGAQFNASYEASGQGDSGLTQGELVLGTNFADGRGNLAIGVTATERDETTQGEREFSEFRQTDGIDSFGNRVLVNGGSTGVPAGHVFGFATNSTTDYIFNEDGSIRQYIENGPNNDNYNYAPVNYLQIPQSRKQVTVTGRLKLAKSLELYGNGTYSDNDVDAQLAPTPLFQFSNITLDGSPYLSSQSQQILSDEAGNGVDTDGDGIDDTARIFFGRRLVEAGNRRIESNRISQQIQAGVRGSIGDVLEYDVYANSGSTELRSERTGAVNRDRYDQALLIDPNSLQFGSPQCLDQTVGANGVSCTPINVFGEGNISPEGIAFIRTIDSRSSKFSQDIQGAALSGNLNILPGGAAKITVGAESTTQRFESDGVAGGSAGFNTEAFFSGEITSDALYANVYLPILMDVPLAERLEATAGYRIEEYSTGFDAISQGASVSWMPTRFLEVRGSYSQNYRAPSIGELFSPQTEGFPGAVDPCSANGNPSPEVAAICVATGVPANLVGTSALNLPSGQVRSISGGNPELEEERSETFSAGVAVGVDLGDDGRLSFGGDIIRISGNNAINTFGGGANNVLSVCYDPFDPSSSVFCNAVNRNANGTLESVELISQNVGIFDYSAIDLFAGANFNFSAGQIGINYLSTIVDENTFEQFSGATVRDCAGNFGNTCGEPQPEYKHLLSAGWSGKGFGAELVWRHLGEVKDDDEFQLFAVDEIEARNYFDAQLTVPLGEHVDLAFGIQNLTDAKPTVLGDNQEQANTYPATYDPFGRMFFLRLSGSADIDDR